MPFTVERPEFTIEYRVVETLPVAQATTQGALAGLWNGVHATAQRWMKVVRFLTTAIPLTLSTIVKVRLMNSDKKTTIIGWVKGLLLGAGSIFFPELPGLSDAVGSLLQLVLAALSILEIVQGWLTNKPSATPEG